jgi:hypothetical protein
LIGTLERPELHSHNELEREATVKKYLIVQTEGSRQVKREVERYSLQAIIAVGFKIENERAVQFRKWANQIVKDYTIQGWTKDVERLKHGGSILDDEFFIIVPTLRRGNVSSGAPAPRY